MRKGDERALQALFEAYHPGLVQYAARQLGNREEARDVVQEVFLSLWNRCATLALDKPLASYLYAATRRASLAIQRHARVVGRWEAEESAALVAAPRVERNAGEGIAEADELAGRIRLTVARMPPRMREIFQLSREQGLSHAEIAATLGLSSKTVAEQILRALQLLRAAVTDAEQREDGGGGKG
jgi:RNA polymerase sigma-70 factor, ECF subfamily